MLEALAAASDTLCAALEAYTSVCLDIQRSYARGEKPHITTPQLPAHMEAEAKLAISLQVKLQKAIAAIDWSWNQSNSRATINDLPSELLARIFLSSSWDAAMLKGRLRLLRAERNRAGIPDSPFPHQAGPLPLYLHVFDSHTYRSTWKICDILKASIAQLASRVISFELDVYNFLEHEDACYEILSTFFNNCKPGKLTQLTLVMPHSGYHVPLLFRDHDPPRHEFLERVNGTFGRYFIPCHDFATPCAYHGLVELRLTVNVPESELVKMIRHSPDLRIFHLDLEMLDPLPANSEITSIPLNNLEALNLVGSISMQAGTFLRWLAPGPKPLLLAVKDSFFHDTQLKDEKSRLFFLRSYITRGYGAWLTPAQFIDFLDLAPNLREMVIRIYEDCKPSQWEIDTIKKVTFYRCELRVGDSRIPEDQISSCTEQLAQIYPGVKFIIRDPKGPNPLKSWNLFEWYGSNSGLIRIPDISG
ncbi:hypothetical protein B0J17DRAFT_632023 [Rhizoctonia solani]|nr:hypothetical protein B0J17DRAFT_632023 [Rhizoctonia solani]